jgi:hypothetical protein
MTTLHPTETAQIIPFGPRPKLVNKTNSLKERITESVLLELLAASSGERAAEIKAVVDERRAIRDARRVNVEEPEISATCKNQRIRNARKKAWNHARSTTEYWWATMDWCSALSYAQSNGIPEALALNNVDFGDRYPLVEKWRAALATQMLTNAPDLGAVNWKRVQLKSGEARRAGMKPEHVELVIARDIEFLTAHPTRKPSKGGAK